MSLTLNSELHCDVRSYQVKFSVFILPRAFFISLFHLFSKSQKYLISQIARILHFSFMPDLSRASFVICQIIVLLLISFMNLVFNSSFAKSIFRISLSQRLSVETLETSSFTILSNIYINK